MAITPKADRRVVPGHFGRKREVSYEARIGDIRASGATATEAKTTVEQLALDALSGDYSPRFYAIPDSDYSILLWREPTAGWGYRILGGDFPTPKGALFTMVHCGVDASLRDMEARARRHVAQLLFDWSDVTASFRALDPRDTEGREQHSRWLGFQLAYREAERRGEADPHTWACRNDKDFAPQSA